MLELINCLHQQNKVLTYEINRVGKSKQGIVSINSTIGDVSVNTTYD